MQPIHSLLAAVGIRPGEAKPVLLVFMLFFGLGLARTFTRSSAYPLFLQQYSSADLPYTYLATSIVITLAMSLYLRVSQRVGLFPLLIGNLGFSMVMQLVIWLALAGGPSPWLALALPTWYEGLCTLLNLVTWGLAAQLFTVRQGKRLFGLVSSGFPLAFIIGGIVTPALVHWVGISQLLLFSIGGILLGLAVVVAVRYFFAKQLAGEQTSPGEARDPVALGALLRHRYVALLCLFFVFSPFVYFVIDNIYYERMNVQFPAAEDLAAFMGLYSMLQGILVLASGALITGPFLNRFGVKAGLVALPFSQIIALLPLALVGSVWGLIPWLFWPVLLAKLLNQAVEAIDSSTRTILYQPLPAATRIQLRAVAEGILKPIVIGAVGVVLLVFIKGFGFTALHLAYMVLVILAGWVFMAQVVGLNYPTMLMNAISRRRLTDEEPTPADGTTRAILQRGLQSPYDDVVIYTINQLANSPNPELPSVLAELMVHPAERVRCHVLQYIEQLALRSLAPMVRERLAMEPSLLVRSAMLRTLAALAVEENFDLLTSYLTDANVANRQSATIGLLRYGGISGVLIAGHQLLHRLESREAGDRIEGAIILGEVGVSQFYQPLLNLLQDPDPNVRLAALAATAQLHSPHLWPAVIAMLGEPPFYRAAMKALVAGGEVAVPAIAVALAAANPDSLQLIRLADVCRRLSNPHLIGALQSRLGAADATVLDHILPALCQCGYRAGGSEVATIKSLFQREGNAAARTIATLCALPEDEAVQLLRSALQSELGRQRTRLLHLLSFVVDAQVVRQARETLEQQNTTAEQRAFALEVLDIVTPPDLKAILLPLLEELTPKQCLERLGVLFPQSTAMLATRLGELLAAPPSRLSHWTIACVLDAVGRLSLTQLAPAVAVFSNSQIALLRQTATWSLARLSVLSGQPLLATPGSPRPVGVADGPQSLSILEQVLILRRVSIFAAVPDPTLAEVAALLEPVALAPYQRLFDKGEQGSAMYVVVAGKVRIHDGDHTFTTLGDREAFGEMALLDGEARSAAATALGETALLELEQERFQALVEEDGSIARGLLKVLAQRLRARSQELAALSVMAG